MAWMRSGVRSPSAPLLGVSCVRRCFPGHRAPRSHTRADRRPIHSERPSSPDLAASGGRFLGAGLFRAVRPPGCRAAGTRRLAATRLGSCTSGSIMRFSAVAAAVALQDAGETRHHDPTVDEHGHERRLRELDSSRGYSGVGARCERSSPHEHMRDGVDRRRVLPLLRRRASQRDAVAQQRMGRLPVQGTRRLRERVRVVVLRGAGGPARQLVR